MNARKIDRGNKKGQKKQRASGPVMMADNNFEVKKGKVQEVIDNYQDKSFAFAEGNRMPKKKKLGLGVINVLSEFVQCYLPEEQEQDEGHS